MSAFFVAINRDFSDFEQDTAERMMSSIDRFGHDAKTLIVQGHFAIGYQSRWCVPEEIGEQQPLIDAQSGNLFVFHGRLDNRHELFDALGCHPTAKLSDAMLVWRFFARHGESRLSDIVGPFVFVVIEPRSNLVIAARDGMGGRYLCYRITNEFILIATYEMPIVKHGSLSFALNDAKVARTLMSEMEPIPTSTVDGVNPLRPGESLSVDVMGERRERFYQYSANKRIHFSSDQQYAAEFQRLLQQAVRRRMRSNGRVATMLSGGLDSVPMTIVAAQQSVETLQAFSWVFDEYPALDERHYSSPVCAKFGIQQHLINCDSMWPRFDKDTHVNPVFPFGIPYSEFQQETFRRAQQHGVKSLLTGIHGDLLYESTQGILYELAGMGRWREALQESRRLCKAMPSKWLFIKHYLLKPLKIVEKLSWYRQRRTRYSTDCLQERVAVLITPKRHWLFKESQGALRPQQWRIVLDAFAGEDAAYGRYMEAKYGVELLARNDKTNFTEVIDAGIKHDKSCKEWFERQPKQWTYYVKECYFDTQEAQKLGSNVIQWRCGYYNYWDSLCATI